MNLYFQVNIGSRINFQIHLCHFAESNIFTNHNKFKLKKYK